MNINFKLESIIYRQTPLITLTFLVCIFPKINYAQDFYKWVDATGSTHYTVNPPPNHVKKLGSISTYQNSNGQSSQSSKRQQTHQNPYQPPFPVTPKDEFTAKERAEIEKQVKQQLQEIKKDPYAAMFGATNEKDIRKSMEVAYQQKKEKFANSRVSNR